MPDPLADLRKLAVGLRADVIAAQEELADADSQVRRRAFVRTVDEF